MAKVGRNDPCPCGSGRKYKNCCMRQDQATESRELGLSPGDAFLLSKLYEYAQRRFASDLVEAFALYWGGIYNLGGTSEVDTQDMRRTLGWFVHDYHTSADGRYVIDMFIETETAGYPPEAKERLEAWSESTMGLFRVLHSAGKRLEICDCLRKGHLEIDDAVLSRNAQAGDLLLGRLFEQNGSQHLSPLTLILPGAYELGLVGYVTNAYDRYVADHYGASWGQFLRESGHIFQAFLLSTQAEALRSLIGPGTRFHDPAITRDKLREFTARSRAEQRQQERAAQERRPPEHRTSAGIILPGAAPKEEQVAEPEEETPPRSAVLIPGRDS